ncbi:Nucleotide-sugar transporter family-containing protein [Strongyloides ratti]|uniref:Nucleotide-sugar transporter family-containing protein n=1 Tax=Strongyloides ratti TaxID=34506 RepID=A0A090KWE6_STRRB|nr:Nucleotide-sugar transporter family-containing protein [Strongyloides ratti]CEF59587.1 Nucleotide-sugar transporter family-containing protein [Strongyloides ratti]
MYNRILLSTIYRNVHITTLLQNIIYKISNYFVFNSNNILLYSPTKVYTFQHISILQPIVEKKKLSCSSFSLLKKLILIIQTTFLVLTLRYSRTKDITDIKWCTSIVVILLTDELHLFYLTCFFVQANGDLMIALVVKYSDNILKFLYLLFYRFLFHELFFNNFLPTFTFVLDIIINKYNVLSF